MAWKLYLFAGVIFEAYTLWGYIKDKVPYTISEIILGGLLDILTWPIVLLINIIDRTR